MMKFKCLLWGVEWCDRQATDFDISHGYCPRCIRKCYTQRIHEAQVRAGYYDCFNRGYDDYREDHCCFRAACPDDLIGEWKKASIRTTEVADPEGLVHTLKLHVYVLISSVVAMGGAKPDFRLIVESRTSAL